jgi:hypothetical protein
MTKRQFVTSLIMNIVIATCSSGWGTVMLWIAWVISFLLLVMEKRPNVTS